MEVKYLKHTHIHDWELIGFFFFFRIEYSITQKLKMG